MYTPNPQCPLSAKCDRGWFPTTCKGENIIKNHFFQCQKNDVLKGLGLKKMIFYDIFKSFFSIKYDSVSRTKMIFSNHFFPLNMIQFQGQK